MLALLLALVLAFHAPVAFPARHMLWFVNKDRSLTATRWLHQDLRLDAVALAHAQDMAQRGYFAHWIPGVGYVGALMTAAGLRPHAWGEIIGWTTFPRSEAIVWLNGAFMASSEHHAIIEGNWTRDGAGVASTRDGRTFVVVVFTR